MIEPVRMGLLMPQNLVPLIGKLKLTVNMQKTFFISIIISVISNSCSAQKSGILTIDFKGKDTCIFLKDENGKPISIDRKLIIPKIQFLIQ